jgi:hypothetical protein
LADGIQDGLSDRALVERGHVENEQALLEMLQIVA